MSVRTQRGFTLVEVLIAAVIMFTVLATATLSLRSAFTASERAARVTELLAPLPWITPLIRESLRADPAPEREGGGRLFGVDYRFHATTARYGAPAPRFDPDVTDFVEYPPRFRLYDIELELERDGETETFLYQELAWQPLAR
jgi:prepilin-type N-terminal cleavage/methylation domain-containing protein